MTILQRTIATLTLTAGLMATCAGCADTGNIIATDTNGRFKFVSRQTITNDLPHGYSAIITVVDTETNELWCYTVGTHGVPSSMQMIVNPDGTPNLYKGEQL